MSSDNSDEVKFVFPEGTNEILVRWFNNIYGNFTVAETKVIWECISKHPEIKKISDQIWIELETCVKFNDVWYVY